MQLRFFKIWPGICAWVQVGSNVKLRNRNTKWFVFVQRSSQQLKNAIFRKHYRSLVSSSLVRQFSHHEVVGWFMVKLKFRWIHISLLLIKNKKLSLNSELWICNAFILYQEGVGIQLRLVNHHSPYHWRSIQYTYGRIYIWWNYIFERGCHHETTAISNWIRKFLKSFGLIFQQI
jgi:hypothetical protein